MWGLGLNKECVGFRPKYRMYGVYARIKSVWVLGQNKEYGGGFRPELRVSGV